MSDFFDKPKVSGSNLHGKASNCRTCGGDKLVVVAVRAAVASSRMTKLGIKLPKVDGMEEWAPCPDCSTADPFFFRADGSQARALDPGKVREWMKR